MTIKKLTKQTEFGSKLQSLGPATENLTLLL